MTTTPRSSSSVGNFVWTFDRFGLGQLVQVEQGCCTVRFFKSVSESFEGTYEFRQLKRAYLPPQTRAYLVDESGVWSVGRIIDYWVESGQVWYDIQLPNQVVRRVGETDLRVRCFLPVDDPASVLATGGMESQYLHDRRRAALESLALARASTYGLTGLLSASVLLMPHQVQVVRQVLSDSVQRYLLADEVGLGKTIEAGAILKQALLDNPEERVLVLAPSALTGQWTRELAWRFFVEQSNYNLRVVSFDELDSVDQSEVDTLVIDEAHNLIASEFESGPRYSRVEHLALRANRLLLISATPVLSNEKTLLALLHLLDPQTYRLDEEEAFRERVQKRQDFGRSLLALDPNQNPVFLRRALQSLEQLTPSDEIVTQLVSAVENAVANGQRDSAAAVLRELHRHVGDTYRLHQRLIRTRRRDLPEWVLTSRSAILEDLLEDDDERTPVVADALDQWRQRSLEHLELVYDGTSPSFESNMADRYARLHEALGISVEACAKELDVQLGEICAGSEQSFDGDQETLEYALGQTKVDTIETRASFATWVIRCALDQIGRIAKPPRIVVFGSSTDLVLEIATRVEEERIAAVFRIVETSYERDVLEAVDAFWKSSNPAVLFCDRRGEEGLNLQFAHGIVHLDLPLAPGRIEQRIGRLDRFGREVIQMEEIYHWIVAPYAECFHPWQAWFELLRDRFRVFDSSISEVQFLLDNLQEEVKLALYRRGAVGMREVEDLIGEAITQERQRLDEQYALDSRTISWKDTEDVFDTISNFDAAVHYEPFDRWVTQVLKFRRENLSDILSHGTFRLHWSPYTLLPIDPWRELFGSESLAQPMTYERRQAAYRRGLRLVRPGLELVDNIEKLLRWDDRGTAFATWRLDPRWRGEGRDAWLGFRLVYVLEANVEAAIGRLSGEVDVLSLRRRMDSLLPPWTITLDVDTRMEQITDPLLMEILARPYSNHADEEGRRDFNLGSRRKVLYSTIGFPQLSDACLRAKEASKELLTNSPQFQRWMNHEARTAMSDLDADNVRLERRNEALTRENGVPSASVGREININAAMAQALNSPSVRLDAIGFVVVSSMPPPKVKDRED